MLAFMWFLANKLWNYEDSVCWQVRTYKWIRNCERQLWTVSAGSLLAEFTTRSKKCKHQCLGQTNVQRITEQSRNRSALKASHTFNCTQNNLSLIKLHIPPQLWTVASNHTLYANSMHGNAQRDGCSLGQSKLQAYFSPFVDQNSSN